MFANVFLTDEQSQEKMPQMFLVDEKAHTLAKKNKTCRKMIQNHEETKRR